MKSPYIFLLISVLLMPVLYFLFGAKLAFVYLLIWADKLIVGLFKPFRYLGIELTTLATVLAAMFYGPIAAFVLILFLFTFLQSLRYLIIPISVPEYPLFVPNPDSIIYALGGVVAGFLLSSPFNVIVVAVVVIKHLMYMAMNLIMHKPPAFLGLIGGVAFHLAVIIPFGLSVIKMIA